MSTCIDERLIIDEVLRIRRGHCKGVGWIVKENGKVSSYSATLSSRSQSKAKQQRRIDERFEAQQREIEALKSLIAQMSIAQSQPPHKDDEDLGRD